MQVQKPHCEGSIRPWCKCLFFPRLRRRWPQLEMCICVVTQSAAGGGYANNVAKNVAQTKPPLCVCMKHHLQRGRIMASFWLQPFWPDLSSGSPTFVADANVFAVSDKLRHRLVRPLYPIFPSRLERPKKWARRIAMRRDARIMKRCAR